MIKYKVVIGPTTTEFKTHAEAEAYLALLQIEAEIVEFFEELPVE